MSKAPVLLLLLLAACGDDHDQDGFAAGEDCDDEDAAVNPGAEEVCNGIDDDCDELVDPPGSEGTIAIYPDPDGDGQGCTTGVRKACYAPDGWAEAGGDEDDCR